VSNQKIKDHEATEDLQIFGKFIDAEPCLGR
jgi:hypothetical protein